VLERVGAIAYFQPLVHFQSLPAWKLVTKKAAPSVRGPLFI
jgi:hypothetical protein